MMAKKMSKKALILLISLLSAFVVAASVVLIVLLPRGGSAPQIVSKDDYGIHRVENTLHKVNVSESNVPFVTNGATKYKIYADKSNTTLKSAIEKSANYVSEQIAAYTGVVVETESELVGWTSETYAVIYGFAEIFAQAGLTMPSEDLGSTGYYIKSVGNSVFIEAKGPDGYRMAGLAFLREAIGYDMISEDCVVYGRSAATMPTMDIVERPDFDYRQIQNYYSDVEVYGMGMQTHSDIWIPVNGWDMHNALYYIPVATYGATHPDWYRNDFMQPCYTAHGVKSEYEAMLQTVFEVIKGRMAVYPELENISFTAMDGGGQEACSCDNCLEYRRLYGTPAATCIYFMNDLNKLVQSYIAENEPGRVMNLIFFAYHDTEPAPVERNKFVDATGNVLWNDAVKDADGNYIPLKKYAQDENNRFIKDAEGNYVYETDAEGNDVYLKCDEHVYPWLAPIYAKYTESFYSSVNATYAQNVSMWYTVSSNVYLWLYGTNFRYYLYPYNSWSAMTENYRYLKECGVSYVWNEGQEHNQSTAFTDLKDYIDSKYFFDVNTDYGQLLEKYFGNYYLEAGEYMRQAFDLIQAQSDYIVHSSSTISGGIYDEIADAAYWPRQMMEYLLELFDKAYQAVEKYKTTDPVLYGRLVTRIKKETMFPRYVLCADYADYYSDIQEMRESFRDDWNALGFSVFREHDGDMQSIFTNGWGL